MSNYKGVKLPALRKVAEEKGLEDYEDLTRDELITQLQAVDIVEEAPVEENQEEAVEEVEGEVIEDKPEILQPKKETPGGIVEERVAVGSKAEIMKQKLALQPKVRIMIPKEKGESKGTTMSVILNGYRLNILKGVYVEVPEQVANVIMDSQDQTVAATENFKRSLDGGNMKFDGEGPEELG